MVYIGVQPPSFVFLGLLICGWLFKQGPCGAFKCIEGVHYDQTPMPLVIAKTILRLGRICHFLDKFFLNNPLMLQVVFKPIGKENQAKLRPFLLFLLALSYFVFSSLFFQVGEPGRYYLWAFIIFFLLFFLYSIYVQMWLMKP